MARVTTEDCTTSIPNRFQLVIYACSRARELLGGTEPNVQKDNDKFTVVALREIADKKIDLGKTWLSIVKNAQKYPKKSDEHFIYLYTDFFLYIFLVLIFIL